MTQVATHLLLEAALSYAAQGFRVFPCHTPAEGGCSCRNKDCSSIGKHPRLMHGLKDASLEPRFIEAWWSKWPLANIGLCTGDGLMVLDVDPRHDGTTAGLDLPDTKRVVTPGGGEHWYYRVEGQVPNSANVIGPGLDIRGDGGYVVAPPSLGASGRHYGWDLGAAEEIVSAPAWLIARARTKRLKERTAEGASVPDAFVAGARNSALTSLGGVMVRAAFGLDAVETALLAENIRRCRPPLDDKEVQGIAASVMRYQPSNPVQGKVATVLGGSQLARALPPIPWVCERLELAPGAPNVWAGYGYSGKTLAAQDLMISVAAGRLAWGHISCASGTVVHLDYEQGQRLSSERYQRLCRASDVDLEALGETIRYVPFPPVYLDTPEGLVWLEDICSGAKLCVIDSLRAAFPSADENSSEIRRYLDPLARLSETTGCTIIIIHHARKRGEKDHGAAQTVRGSSAIFDACQSVLVFDGKKGEPSIVSLEKARITGSSPDDLALVFEDASGASTNPEHDGREDPKWGLRVRGESAVKSDGLDGVRSALIDTVRKNPGRSKRFIVAETKGKAPVLLELLDELLDVGKLVSKERTGRGGGLAIYLPVEASLDDPMTEDDFDN